MRNEQDLDYFIQVEKLNVSDDFLSQKPFSTFENCKNYKFDNEYDNILTPLEKVILSLFLGKFSFYFRSGNLVLLEVMKNALDNLLMKVPKCPANQLYRFLRDHDERNFSEGDIYIPQFSLTTSLEILQEDKDLYIITPLPTEETNARELYRILNHGEEYQVNFLSGTKFEITKIEERESKRIYLKEIK